MTLVPFNAELNRFLLVVPNAPAGRYRVTWGETSKTYTAEELAKGVNLAADFEINPFSEAFKRVDEAVAKKQAYETRQIKDLFHGPEGQADMTMTAALTEKVRTPLADAIAQRLRPGPAHDRHHGRHETLIPGISRFAGSGIGLFDRCSASMGDSLTAGVTFNASRRGRAAAGAWRRRPRRR